MSEYHDEHDDDGAGQTKVPTGQRERLLAIAEEAELWHDADARGYATIDAGDHKEHHPLRSPAFKRWLGRKYYQYHGGAPSSQAQEEALRAVEAQAHFEGDTAEPALRVAEHHGVVYVDLANEQWEAVQIDRYGWKIVMDPPVRFLRPSGMRALPTPERGGSINDLRPLVNVTEGEFKLFVGFLVGALRPKGPYPILIASGEQGSGKSSTCRVARRAIDPSKVLLRSPPREERDLLVAARNSWIVALDNMSRVLEWQADGLCRLATGGGYGARELFTDLSEVLFEASRPIILNGIPDLATRPDLADRAIVISHPTLAPGSVKSEADLECATEAALPGIIGALFDAASCALRRQGEVHIAELPRMADFNLWVEAAAPALGWREGEFTHTYRANRTQAVRLTLEADLVAVEVQTFIESKRRWEGTASGLLDALNEKVSDSTSRAKEWPKAANALSGKLRRAAPALRSEGITVADRKLDGRTIWTLEQQTIGPDDPTYPTYPTSLITEAKDNTGLDGAAPSGIASGMSGVAKSTPLGTENDKLLNENAFVPDRGAKCDKWDDSVLSSDTHGDDERQTIQAVDGDG